MIGVADQNSRPGVHGIFLTKIRYCNRVFSIDEKMSGAEPIVGVNSKKLGTRRAERLKMLLKIIRSVWLKP